MNLPQLPADKANHLAYGAAIAVVGSCYSLWVGLGLCVAFAIAKEISDAWLNFRATGKPLEGPHGVEVLDALATTAGGVLAVAPAFINQIH